jgi:hypothetical protein
MKRTDFYHREKTELNGVSYEELDFLNNTLSDFEFKHTPGHYRVVGTDLMRLDLIAYKVYEEVKFWWILALVNEINEPFSDLEEGQLLIIPSLLDIYEFQKKYRVRRIT